MSQAVPNPHDLSVIVTVDTIQTGYVANPAGPGAWLQIYATDSSGVGRNYYSLPPSLPVAVVMAWALMATSARATGMPVRFGYDNRTGDVPDGDYGANLHWIEIPG